MHNLTVGRSNSGKTLLNMFLAHNAVKKNETVIVYDPNESRGWPIQAKKFSSPKKFLQHLQNVQCAHVFIDEAKTLWDYDERAGDELLYRRRHDGILIYLIAQRANMVRPNARNQCSKLFAFRQSVDDAKILAGDYGDDVIKCADLPEIHFLMSTGFKIEPYRLDFSTNPPHPVKVK